MKKELLSSVKMKWAMYSISEMQSIVSEYFIEQPVVCYIISGKVKVTFTSGEIVFGAGQFLLVRKNSLVKFSHYADGKRNFKSIALVLERKILQNFSRENDLYYEQSFDKQHTVLELENGQLLESYFESLVPYFFSTLPDKLTILKRQEAIMLLLEINPALKNVLFDFSQPDKVDLEAFMQQNFRFNVALSKIAYLTGRSLATLKRDFQKIFHTSPNRWLQRRRLQEAYYLISEQHKRPSDVYLEVGFESLSHFSYSFKKFYGINPSDI